VERALVCPPRSQIGPITPAQRQEIMRTSVIAGVYENAIDRESAYELLKGRAAQAATESAPQSPQHPGPKPWYGDLLGSGSAGGRRGDTLAETIAKSAARTLGSTVGRQLVRGVLGSLLGGTRRR
jgi:hypothetical protein